MRQRRQDAWIASVRISIPIDATDVASIQRAQESVAKLASLIPGSTVEITHAGFGRMALAATPSLPLAGEITVDERGVLTKVTPPATVEPEIPEYLRRVPRRVDGNGTPMDPSGDGSYRGADGAQ